MSQTRPKPESGVSHVKNDHIWIKRPVREHRDEQNFSYANLSVSKDGTKIRVSPAEGAEVTGESYEVSDGKIDCEGIGDALSVELHDLGITFETTYDANSDAFIIDLTTPTFDNTKEKLVHYIRKELGLEDGPLTRLTKSEVMEVWGCEDQFELARKFKEWDGECSVNVTFHINKPGYQKLAEEAFEERESD